MALKFDPVLGRLREKDVSSGGSATWGNLIGTLSDQTDLQNAINSKVDKVTGKGLSANDYTGTEKAKLAGIESGAQVNVNPDWNSTGGSSQILNKPSLGTASAMNAPSTGNATTGQVVIGSDSRLTDSRNPTAHLHSEGDIINLTTDLAAKVNKNTDITGATKTKLTYDSKGLITAGADATTADIADSPDKRYVTDAQKTVLNNTSGTNTGDQNLSSYALSTDVVPITRTINTKPLNANLTLTQDDVGDGTTNKQYSSTDKSKLAGIQANATAGADWNTNVSNKPTLGTSSSKDVPATGNASSTQVVLGSDTRLTDSRTPTAHTHTESDLSLSDVTTNNASTTKHGLLPKLPGTTTTFLRGDGSFATPPSGGGSNPAWYGVLYGAYGECNPQQILDLSLMLATVAVTPTNISTTVARICYFRPPADISVNKIRFYGVGATTGVYQIAIYNAITRARVTAQLSINTALNAWGSVSAGPVTLTAGTLYYLAISVNTTGTTAGLMCMSASKTSTTGQIAVLPSTFPGSLAIGSGYISGAFAQFAVTGGALPSTAPALTAQAAWTGGFPSFWLDSNSA